MSWTGEDDTTTRSPWRYRNGDSTVDTIRGLFQDCRPQADAIADLFAMLESLTRREELRAETGSTHRQH